MNEGRSAGCIFVLAGTNGAGKSSVGGAMFAGEGSPYFNPDEATQAILKANPGCTLSEANSAAWQQGKRLLQRAIAERGTYAFETTLGGNTIPSLLEEAARAGIEVNVWFVGLRTPELHIARVRARAAAGGHDIPDEKIRYRYESSRANLVRLLPLLTELRLFDNSEDGSPALGTPPNPQLLLHVKKGQVLFSCSRESTPAWAQSIVSAASRLP